MALYALAMSFPPPILRLPAPPQIAYTRPAASGTTIGWAGGTPGALDVVTVYLFDGVGNPAGVWRGVAPGSWDHVTIPAAVALPSPGSAAASVRTLGLAGATIDAFDENDFDFAAADGVSSEAQFALP